MASRKRQRAEFWERSDVPYCMCPALAYRHTHCPCEHCHGDAVSRSTEFRHWLAAKREFQDLPVATTPTTVVLGHDREDHHRAPTSPTHSNCLGVDVNSHTLSLSSQENSLASAMEGDSHQPTTDLPDVSKQGNGAIGDIVWSIVEAMQLVEDMDASQHNFMQILAFGKHLYERGLQARSTECDETSNLWPKSWQAALKVLQEAGYMAPKKFYVCLNASHYCTWDVLSGERDPCRHCGEPGVIQYYYLSLFDKVQRWCSHEDFCHKMTAHWEERDHWLSGSGWWPRKEIWDGSRFAELSWFWDPEQEWLLPVKCPECSTVMSTEHIKESLGAQDQQQVEISCTECHKSFRHTLQYARGDPRNIALIGHWDGFRPFRSTGQHSCGSIEVSIATMKKEERSKIDEVYVLGFVPSYLLPHKRPCLLDPFLHPLICEIEDAFIDGIEVDYRASVAGIAPGKASVRCILLCWTGDYPAQSEVGKFIKNGKHPCRRDMLEGKLLPGSTTHYYGDVRYHVRHNWPARSLEDSLPKMKSVDEEDRVSVRATMAKACGFTGLSVLHRLHQLYGFDVLQDMVYDAMHNIPMNVLSQHLHHYLENGFYSNTNKRLVEKRLDAMPWPAELKSGRIPTGLTHRLGFWKAEELHKFSFPASECVLGGILPDREYHIWILAVRLTELVFGVGRSGWSEEMLHLAQRLIQRHNILTEEVQGLTKCHVTFHNLTHMLEDVQRFSSPDNYWCFAFERAVCKYVERSSNKKNIECTFANAESRSEFLKFSRHTQKDERSIPLPDEGELLCANSIAAAHDLAKAHPSLASEGILVGKRTLCDLSPQDQAEVGSDEETVSQFHRIFVSRHGHRGMQYRVSEFALVSGLDSEAQVVLIVAIFAIRSHVGYQTFIKGERYPYMLNEEGEMERHPYSDGPKVVSSSVRVFIPTNNIARKVILFPDPDKTEDPTFYIVVDYLRPKIPLTPQDILVPFYPQKDDMVLVRGDSTADVWVALIHAVDKGRQTCQVYFYTETRPLSNTYTRESYSRRALETVDWDSILGTARGRWNGNEWNRSN